MAEKTRLQTELDLLRTQQGDQARFNALEGQFKHMEWVMQQFINTYSGGAKAASQNG